MVPSACRLSLFLYYRKKEVRTIGGHTVYKKSVWHVFRYGIGVRFLEDCCGINGKTANYVIT